MLQHPDNRPVRFDMSVFLIPYYYSIYIVLWS